MLSATRMNHIHGLSAGNRLQRHSCTPLQQPTFKDVPVFKDNASKLVIMASPKGGATLSARLMFARLNLTAEGIALGNYPFDFARRFWNTHGHNTHRDLEVCADRSWWCLAIVRNPMDRAISAYIYSMVTHKKIGRHLSLELKRVCGPDCMQNASFSQFTAALDERAQNVYAHRAWEDLHFMPMQRFPDCCRDGGCARGCNWTVADRPRALHVPIEIFDHESVGSCRYLKPVQPWRMAELENAEGHRASTRLSKHYVRQMPSRRVLGIEQWPSSRILEAVSAHKMPAYDSFWANKTLCRHVVGCLYRADLELYVRTCSQHGITRGSSCKAYREVCKRELARLRTVCGVQIHAGSRLSQLPAPHIR